MTKSKPTGNPNIQTPADVLEYLETPEAAESSPRPPELSTTSLEEEPTARSSSLKQGLSYLAEPVRLFKSYDTNNLRPDFIAGLTVGVIALPQVIAFALIAELPPQMGLYAAIVAGLIGALWGATNEMNTGPANAISILVLSALLGIAEPGSGEFIIAAGVLAVMAGMFQMVIGLSGLGVLVNFVSYSVIVGFTAGAGVLIGINQLKSLLGLTFESRNLLDTLQGTLLNLPNTHPPTAALGIGTIVLIVLLRNFAPKMPGPLLGMLVASAAVFVVGPTTLDVQVIGELPTGLPPIAPLPIFDLNLIARLSTGALAVGTIGLIQTTAIARAMAAQTGQRPDSNQEFVGQGLANIAAGVFSGYAGAGSFARSAVNAEAGARTRISSLFGSIFIFIAMLSLGPLGAYLPQAALAGVLIVTAYGLVDGKEMVSIWQGNRNDAIIMIVTFLGTLFLQIEFAVLLGVLISFAFYITQTSVPRVYTVLPDRHFQHFEPRPPHKPGCPQLGIINISGDLYFGAVSHVENVILEHARKHADERFLLIRMQAINNCDISGIRMLETIARTYRERGGDIFFVKVQEPVWELMVSTDFHTKIGEEHFLSEEKAISYTFHQILDAAICIYECPVRAFKECQNLPKSDYPQELPPLTAIHREQIATIEPLALWKQLEHPYSSPMVVDVREPREYMRSHIPHAESLPLAQAISESERLPTDKEIVLVCRSGRRSLRAAAALQDKGMTQLSVLAGGMLAWEDAGLMKAMKFNFD